LCSLQVVSELSPFAVAEPTRLRCRACFAKVDKDGHLKSA